MLFQILALISEFNLHKLKDFTLDSTKLTTNIFGQRRTHFLMYLMRSITQCL